MTRLPTSSGLQARTATPDVYSALLLVGCIFLLVACVFVTYDLVANYKLTFAQLFTGVKSQP